MATDHLYRDRIRRTHPLVCLRLDQVVDLIRSREPMTFSDLMRAFPESHNKTIRRRVERAIEQGLIQSDGTYFTASQS